MKYQAWKGDFVNAYFKNLDKGKWVSVSFLRYLWLKLNGYIVRKSNHPK